MVNEEATVRVKRIEEALRKLGFDDKEIAYWLLRFDLAIRETMGKKILAKLPEEKQKQVEAMMKENKSVADLWALVEEDFSLAQAKAVYEEKLKEIEEELSLWADEMVGIFDQARERIKKEILPRLSS